MRSIFLLLLLASSSLIGQADDIALRVAQAIDSQDLRKYVFALASKDFGGRETGSEGNMKAASYIAAQFAGFGIPTLPGSNSYFQEVDFTSFRWNENTLKINGRESSHYKEFLSISQLFATSGSEMNIDELTFLGYGIDDATYSDYAGMDVTGKHLLVYAGEPRDRDGNFRITGGNKPSDWSDNLSLKLQKAKAAGAASIWIIEDKLRDKVMEARRGQLSGSMLMGSPAMFENDGLPHALISTTMAQELLGKYSKKVIKLRDKITKKGKPGSLSFPVQMEWNFNREIKTTNGVNVLGYIEGTDPVLKNEIVIVTAHYDHLGMRGNDIFYGADDNASGTSAVIEIAQAMMNAKKEGLGPRRSVLCMLVTGEEKGLLGSEYYSEHPIFPLQNTVANVNIDMIGRTDEKHDHPRYTYVIGSDRLSTSLHAINESVNDKYTQLELDYTYNRDDDPNRFYYRSDHYNFAKKGIPAIFYFSGVHEDYHRPTDTPDKIMFGKAVNIAKLAFHTAWALANRDERIQVDVTGRN